MAHQCEEATIDRQLTVTAGIDGAHLSKLIHEMTESRRVARTIKPLPTEGMELPCGQTFLESVLLAA
jgi:hypothetical protein